jgi:hypothetical protein
MWKQKWISRGSGLVQAWNSVQWAFGVIDKEENLAM